MERYARLRRAISIAADTPEACVPNKLPANVVTLTRQRNYQKKTPLAGANGVRDRVRTPARAFCAAARQRRAYRQYLTVTLKVPLLSL